MKNLFLLILLGFSLGSCMTNLSMQTGRTLEQGEVQVTAGSTNIGAYKNESTKSNQTQTETNLSSLDPGTTFGRLKVGVGNNTDVGLTLGFSSVLSGSIEGEVKHQFIGNKNDLFAVSAGLKIGLAGALGLGSINYTIPIYASIHPTEYVSFYTSPRFKSVSFTEILGGTSSTNFFGLVNGLNLSYSSFDLYFEHSLLFHKEAMNDRGQLNAGIAFRF